jgi:hypothetical protein
MYATSVRLGRFLNTTRREGGRSVENRVSFGRLITAHAFISIPRIPAHSTPDQRRSCLRHFSHVLCAEARAQRLSSTARTFRNPHTGSNGDSIRRSKRGLGYLMVLIYAPLRPASPPRSDARYRRYWPSRSDKSSAPKNHCGFSLKKPTNSFLIQIW